MYIFRTWRLSRAEVGLGSIICPVSHEPFYTFSLEGSMAGRPRPYFGARSDTVLFLSTEHVRENKKGLVLLRRQSHRSSDHDTQAFDTTLHDLVTRDGMHWPAEAVDDIALDDCGGVVVHLSRAMNTLYVAEYGL
jgi:hypothetical protein